MSTQDELNGDGPDTPAVAVAADRAIPDAPEQIADLAAACVGQVHAAVGVTLDFAPETLPVLDHYMSEARAAVHDRPEALALVAQCVGAYLGEVVRRRHVSWWGLLGPDPTDWQVRFEVAYVIVRPVALARAALLRGDGQERLGDEDVEPWGCIELDDADRTRLATRLADLPVREDELWSAATMLEVLDIAVDEIRAHRAAAREPDVALRPQDYED